MAVAQYKPPVTETKIVEVESEKVVVTLTRAEFHALLRGLGELSFGHETQGVYAALRRVDLPSRSPVESDEDEGACLCAECED